MLQFFITAINAIKKPQISFQEYIVDSLSQFQTCRKGYSSPESTKGLKMLKQNLLQLKL